MLCPWRYDQGWQVLEDSIFGAAGTGAFLAAALNLALPLVCCGRPAALLPPGQTKCVCGGG